MANALADMTPEEQQACEGMWAEWRYGAGQMMLVVIEEIHPVRDYAVCVVPRVRYVEPPRSALFPRHDLLRAWNPDGTPPDGSWEYSSAELPLPDYSGKYTQHYRRHATEWEATNGGPSLPSKPS